MYSLMNPQDVQNVIQETAPVFGIESNENRSVTSPKLPQILPAPPSNAQQINTDKTENPVVKEQVTTPVVSENALVPYTPNFNEPQPENSFDILELLSDGSDADLILAATQIENETEKPCLQHQQQRPPPAANLW